MIDIFLNYGPNLTYVGIIVFLVLTGAGLPLPEEVAIVAAGVLSSGDEPFLNVYFAFAACLIGALLGDLLVYSIGRFLGTGFLRRHPHFAHWLHEEREKQMEEAIRRHGIHVFFVARFMVGVRAPLYLAAGMLKLPWRRFLLVDSIAATTVVSLVFWLSYRYGRVIGNLLRQSQIALTALAVIVGLVMLVVYLRHRRAANEADAGDTHKKEAVSATSKDTANRNVA